MKVPSHAFTAIQCLLSPACFASPAFCLNIVLCLSHVPFFSCNSELPFLILSLCSCALTFASCVYVPPLEYFFLHNFPSLVHFPSYYLSFPSACCHLYACCLSFTYFVIHVGFTCHMLCCSLICALSLVSCALPFSLFFLSFCLSSVFCAHALPLMHVHFVSCVRALPLCLPHVHFVAMSFMLCSQCVDLGILLS